jgi:hypothetical protein
MMQVLIQNLHLELHDVNAPITIGQTSIHYLAKRYVISADN